MSKNINNQRLKNVTTFPFPPDFNISNDLVQSNVRASETYIVPAKPTLTGVKKISGSIVLAENTHEFYGFNGKIWTPFKTAPVGIAQVLAVDNNANGLSLIGLNTLQGIGLNTIFATVQSISVGSLSLGGDLNMNGNNMVNVNYLTANTVTATLLTGNVIDFERTVPTISTSVIDTLIDYNSISFNWANRIGGDGKEIVNAISANDNNSVVLAGTFNSSFDIYKNGGIQQVPIKYTNVYAGGDFTTVNSISASKIAKLEKYDFNNYIVSNYTTTTLNTGLDNRCDALAIDPISGNVYAGGRFTDKGQYIAKWNPYSKTWSGVGGGLDYHCYAIAISNIGTVYAGGTFTSAGGNAVNGVAKWNGASWSSLGGGIKGACLALAIDNQLNTIYVGGAFTLVGNNNVSANNIAKWNATTNTWSPLGDGLNNYCWALALDSNSGALYAGGSFTVAGISKTNYVAKWDGTNWQALPGLPASVDHVCLSLVIDSSGNVYAGGDFTLPGPIFPSIICKWNGTSWSAFGDIYWGSVDFITAMALDDENNLYAGYDGNGIVKLSGGGAFTSFPTDNLCWALAVTTLGVMSDSPLNSFVVRYASNNIEYEGVTITKGNPVWFGKLGGYNTAKSASVNDIYYDLVYYIGFYRSDINVGVTYTLLNIHNIDDTFITSYSSLTIASAIVKYTELYYDTDNLVSINYHWTAILSGNDTVKINSTTTDNSGIIYDTSIDKPGKVCAIGNYRANPLEIYNSSGFLAATLENSGGEDTFIVRYYSTGDYLWSTRLSSPETDVGTFIATNKSGTDIVVTGYYTTSPLSIYAVGGLVEVNQLQSIGVENIFVVKYDNSGNYQWGRYISGTGSMYRSACIDVNGLGDIVVVANYSGTLLQVYDVLGAPVITLACSSTFGDALIVKYDTFGTPQWATRISSSKQEIASVSINNVGEIMVTGYFTNSDLNIYSIHGITIIATLANTGAEDVYIVKYSTNGVFQTLSHVVSANAKSESGKAITMNNLGDVLVTGTYTNTPTYLEIYDSLNNIVSSLPFDAGTDSFLICYNNTSVFTLGNPELDGQLKSIQSSTQTSYIYPEGTVNSSRKAIKLQTNESISMIWDTLEGNWIILDNTGSLI